MIALAGDVTGTTFVASERGIGASLEELLADGEISTASSRVKGCFLVLVAKVWIGSGGEEEGNALILSTEARDVKRCFSLGVLLVHVHSLADHVPEDPFVQVGVRLLGLHSHKVVKRQRSV